MSKERYNQDEEGAGIGGENTRDGGDAADDDPFTDDDVTSILDEAWDEILP